MKKEELQSMKDILEKKTGLFLNKFIAETDVEIDAVHVWVGKTGKWVVELDLFDSEGK